VKKGVDLYYSRAPKSIIDLSAMLQLQGGVTPQASSFLTVEFIPTEFSGELSEQDELDRYASDKKQKFFEKMGLWGYYYPVTLSSTATSQFTDNGIPFATGRYFGEIQEETSAGLFQGRYVLIIKTKGGFWEIVWNGTEQELESNKNVFYEIVKNVRIKTPEEVAMMRSVKSQHVDEAVTNNNHIDAVSEAIKNIAKTLLSVKKQQ